MKGTTIAYIAIIICNVDQLSTSAEADEKFEFKKLIPVYEYDVNRYRKLLNGQGMSYVSWNTTLQNKTRTIGKQIIEALGCKAKWDCKYDNCDGNVIVRMKLNDVRLQHRIMRSGNEVDHAMGRMFDFLGIDSPAECGKRYDKYDHNFKPCKVNAHKTFDLTNRVGCTYFSCRNTALEFENFHFVCIFDAISDPVVDGNGYATLYSRQTTDMGQCSACHPMVPRCKNGLCVSAALSFNELDSNLFISIVLLLIAKDL